MTIDDEAVMRQWTALPHGALPGSAWENFDLDDVEAGRAVELALRGQWDLGTATVRLYADRPGWRDGRVVTLP